MIEHNALYNGPLRLWSEVAMFRHERPQKGRYRQFHQIDVEALGHAGPDVDAEQILMCRALLQDLGLVVGSDVRLEINSLGQPDERSAHRAALIALPRAARRRARRGRAAPPAQQSAAHPRQQEPGDAGDRSTARRG